MYRHTYADQLLTPLSVVPDFRKRFVDPVPDFRTLGWVEFPLPDNSSYFGLAVSSTNSSLPKTSKLPLPSPAPSTLEHSVSVVADFDLHDLPLLRRVCEMMEEILKTEVPTSNPLEGNWELWLHRPTNTETYNAARPPITHTWVNHTRRLLVNRPLASKPPTEDGDSKTLVDEAIQESERERLVRELAYWGYVERHPAHSSLVAGARREALEGLTWSYAGKFLLL